MAPLHGPWLALPLRDPAQDPAKPACLLSQEVANRGPEKALNALLAAGGGMLLMLRSEWRLGLLALLLRAPLLGALATAAGKTVGLYSALQTHALNNANALAAEALAQSRAVTASDAASGVLEEYAARVRAYAEVVRATLLSETVLRFTRLLIERFSAFVLLVAGLLAVLRGGVSLGALLSFYAYADTFARGCADLQATTEQMRLATLPTKTCQTHPANAILSNGAPCSHGV